MFSILSSQLTAVRARLEELDGRLDRRPYDKQKNSLVGSPDIFLQKNHGSGYYTEGSRSEGASPEDVVKFLIDRDSRWKTQVHILGCRFVGKRGLQECGCKRHLAAGTVDSYIGQLRAYTLTQPAEGYRGARRPRRGTRAYRIE